MSLEFILPPITGAVIGWITNYVAIKLLFRPHKPFDLLGYQVQGVIPKRRKEIARSMAKAIEKELLSSHDLAGLLGKINWKEEVEKAIGDAVEHRFSNSRLGKLPVVGVVSDNIKYHVKYLLTKEFVRQLDMKKDALASKVRDNIDIKELLVEKIDGLDLMKFERLLTDFIARELKHLEYLGGVMGFFIGLAQSMINYYMG